MRNYFKHGCWNVICDVCGKKLKSDMVRKRWDGLYVCKNDWEVRHPQDFIKVTGEKQTVPFRRPPTTDQYVTVNYYSLNLTTALAGYGGAGYATVGNNTLTGE